MLLRLGVVCVGVGVGDGCWWVDVIVVFVVGVGWVVCWLGCMCLLILFIGCFCIVVGVVMV